MDECRLFVFSFLNRRYIFIKLRFMLSARATKILRTGIVRESVGPGSGLFFLSRVCRGVVAERARAFVFFMSGFFSDFFFWMMASFV
jgi:hypothetical protein